MEPSKIKILGIAPYEGMKTVMEKTAVKFPNVQLDVFVGDLKQGESIVKNRIHQDYDIIISRGGTAELIERSAHIPVVEISLSVFDILRAIKLAENYTAQYAVVGFPGITSCAHLLCSLLQYQLEIFTIHSEQEVREILPVLKSKGYKMVLCDMITETTAKALGLNSILITSGTESIESAFEEAVHLYAMEKQLLTRCRFLEQVLRHSDAKTAVFDSENQLVFSTLSDEEKYLLLPALTRELAVCRRSPQDSRTLLKAGAEVYPASSAELYCGQTPYLVFSIQQPRASLSFGKPGIRLFSRKEVEESLSESFYSISGALSEIHDAITRISQSRFPVMICGREGTGRAQAAKAIFLESSFRQASFLTIDCSLLTDKSWNYLTGNDNSPFCENDNTLYLRSPEFLDRQKRNQLLSMILDSSLHTRNRLIFSCSASLDGTIPAACLEFVNALSCQTFHLHALKEQAQEIPILSSLYLGILNVRLAKQIIGFAPGAMELLLTYSWPQNHEQLKRCLTELALRTDSSYISLEDVQNLLEKEQSSIPDPCSPQITSCFAAGQEQTLEAITRGVINDALKRCRGNQSLAAKQLGISRTTLWRYIKK